MKGLLGQFWVSQAILAVVGDTLEMSRRMIVCTLCGSTFARLSFCKNHYRLNECLQCGHVFVWPLPSAEETSKFYKSSYNSTYLEGVRLWFEQLGRKRIEIVEQFFAETDSCRRVLDVGSGYGFFLAEARRHGWRGVGIEPALEPLRFARENLDIEVIQGDVSNVIPLLPRDAYDIITFWHVLEHVEFPAAVLKAAISVLKPRGYVLVNSPNLDSAVFHLLGKRWTWIYVPGHLQYFSIGPLAAWMTANGLSVVRSETWSENPNLYFAIEEAFLIGISDILLKLPFTSPVGQWLRTFAHGSFNHHIIQHKLKRLYDCTPQLNRYLIKKRKGHELLIAARKD